MSSTKKIVGQLRQLRELITKSPVKKVTSSKRVVSTKTESVHTSSTHHRKKDSEVTSTEIRSRSERTESKANSKARSRTSAKTAKSVTTKTVERKPIKASRNVDVPPSIRDSKFRTRKEPEVEERKTIRYKDTFVDPVPSLKRRKSPPKKLVDDEIHRFTSKIIQKHEDSSDSDEFLLKPCKQAIQSRAVIKRRVIASSSDDSTPPRKTAKKCDFLDESSSSDSEFKARMKRVSALTSGRTVKRSPVRKAPRISSSTSSGSDVKVSKRVIESSSDSSDFKMPVIKRRTDAHIRPDIQKILDSINTSDYSDEDMKLVTPPKRAKKKADVSSSSGSVEAMARQKVASNGIRPTLQLSVPISVSTRMESDSSSSVDVRKTKTSKSKATEIEDSELDVRAELLRKYGVFTSSSDEGPTESKGSATKKTSSPSMSRDDIKSRLAKFGIGSSDSEEYASSDGETISQRLLSKHEYASKLVDMKDETSSTKKQLKAKMQELGVTDSSSSGVAAAAPPPAEEPRKARTSSGVDKNFLRKYGISDSSSAEEEEVIELVNPHELKARSKKATSSTVDSSLVRDQKHILAAYGVTDSSSEEKEDSSKLLAGSLRERLQKIDMTDEEPEPAQPVQKKTAYEISSSSSDVFDLTRPAEKSTNVSPVKPTKQPPKEAAARRITDGLTVDDDVTPEEILMSSLSNSGQLKSAIQAAHLSSDEEEEPVVPAKKASALSKPLVLSPSTSTSSSGVETPARVSQAVGATGRSASSSTSLGLGRGKKALIVEEEDAHETATVSLASRARRLVFEEEEEKHETVKSTGLASRAKQVLIEEEEEAAEHDTSSSVDLSRVKQILAEEEEEENEPAPVNLARVNKLLVDEEEEEDASASVSLARAKKLLVDEEEEEGASASLSLARAKKLLVEEEDEPETFTRGKPIIAEEEDGSDAAGSVGRVYRAKRFLVEEEDEHEATHSIGLTRVRKLLVEEEDEHEATVRRVTTAKHVLVEEEEDNAEPVIMIDQELVQAGPKIRIPTPVPSIGVLNAVANGEESSNEDLDVVKKPARPIPKPPQKVAAPKDISSSSDEDLKLQFQNMKTALMNTQSGSDSDSPDTKAPARIPLKVSRSSDNEADQPVAAAHPTQGQEDSEDDDSDTSLGLTAEAILSKYNISLGDDSGSGDDIDLDDVDRKTQEILERFK